MIEENVCYCEKNNYTAILILLSYKNLTRFFLLEEGVVFENSFYCNFHLAHNTRIIYCNTCLYLNLVRNNIVFRIDNCLIYTG